MADLIEKKYLEYKQYINSPEFKTYSFIPLFERFHKAALLDGNFMLARQIKITVDELKVDT